MELERQLSSKMDRQEAIEVCESLRDYLYNARSTPNAELYRRLDIMLERFANLLRELEDSDEGIEKEVGYLDESETA